MPGKAPLRRKFSRLSVDGFLVTDLVNVRYLTGFTGSSGCVIIARKHAVFLTDFRYQEQAGEEIKEYDIRIERGERTGEIKAVCQDLGIRKLGFEDHRVSVEFYRKLKRRKVKTKPLSQVVESLRVSKSDEELKKIRKAARRAQRAFRKLQPAIRAGATELKIAMKFEDLLRKEGCKSLPFGVIVASGPRSALPHASPTTRRLRNGDLVLFDWGGECDGYYSDMSRTLLLRGKDMARQKEIYSRVLDAQTKALRAVRAGIRASRIDAAARNSIKKDGYEDFFGHGTGHGVGLAVHEKPVVSWRSKEIIPEDSVFTVEPGIYLPGLGGVRIEDMVRAQKGGSEVITSLPRKLLVKEK